MPVGEFALVNGSFKEYVYRGVSFVALYPLESAFYFCFRAFENLIKRILSMQ